MESAGVDFRAGLDGALPDDGHGGLVGLEKVRLGKGVGVLWGSVAVERRLDTAVFLGEATGLGAGGHHRDVGGDFGDDGGLFQGQENSRVVDGAVFRVGEFRDGAELHTLEDELGEPVFDRLGRLFRVWSDGKRYPFRVIRAFRGLSSANLPNVRARRCAGDGWD